MNLHDLQCILAIAQEGSINRAAQKLFVSQPSLSKCVKKLEKEYGILIFRRSAGSSLAITDEGDCFLKMAEDILQRHKMFENQLRWLKDQQGDKIVLGMTFRNSFTLASPLLQWLLENDPHYFVTLQVENTAGLKRGLRDGRFNMALFASLQQDIEPEFCYRIIRPSMTWIYLKKGSRIGRHAVRLSGVEWPVLRMKDLEGEVLAVNTPGSSSRWKIEKLLEKHRVSCEFLELPDFTNRFMAAEAGRATLLIDLQPETDVHLDPERLFFLHPEDNLLSAMVLACRKNFQNDPRFLAVLAGVQQCFQEDRPLWYQQFLDKQLPRKEHG